MKLNKIFLNQVFVDALVEDDIMLILETQFPQLSPIVINKMVKFNSRISSEVGVTWGHLGSPWEMNLRDITRWCEVTIKSSSKGIYNPGNGVELIYIHRMRTSEDQKMVRH